MRRSHLGCAFAPRPGHKLHPHKDATSGPGLRPPPVPDAIYVFMRT